MRLTAAEELWPRLLAEAWTALGGGWPLPALQVTGTPGHLPSHLPVEDTAIACAGAALLAASALQAQRGGTAPRAARLDRGHVAAVFRSEARVQLNGQAVGAGFAPLSRFWRASGGWVRTHGTIPGTETPCCTRSAAALIARQSARPSRAWARARSRTW